MSFKDEWKTTANLITIVRIVLIPVFVIALLAPWPSWFFDPSVDNIQQIEYIDAAIKPWVAAVIYAILALTDGLDGYIARSRDQVTDLGKFLDPIADKVLVAAALLALIELGDLPSWVVLVIITREFIVSGLRMLAASEGVVVAARMSGKVKTALTLVAIILFIVKRSSIVMSLPDNVYMAIFVLAWGLMIAAVVMTVVSMVQYFIDVMRILDEAEHPSEVAAEVLDLAREKGVHLATAESLTGGKIGSTFTAVPGSSDVFEGGVISYSYDVKSAELGVSPDDLEEYGAVSEPVAIQMADGARRNVLGGYDDDHAVAVAVTGVAGPGESEGKPAGMVWFAVAGKGDTVASCERFEGDRDEVRQKTVVHAMELVEERLKAE